ncbi:hypothetical protein PYW07_008647 [Mythimna separata]|uniref:Uncharacterized protein n=1 Tax=Mythimna separata TaxID=271217 RepID=A0AAD8DN22_MYTSE|nr:hypothetical protein PYW07_008647 [Mythimna separata]
MHRLRDDSFVWMLTGTGDQLPNYVSDSLTTVSETGEEEEDIDNDQPTDWSSDDEDTQDIDDYDDND